MYNVYPNFRYKENVVVSFLKHGPPFFARPAYFRNCMDLDSDANSCSRRISRPLRLRLKGSQTCSKY